MEGRNLSSQLILLKFRLLQSQASSSLYGTRVEPTAANQLKSPATMDDALDVVETQMALERTALDVEEKKVLKVLGQYEMASSLVDGSGGGTSSTRVKGKPQTYSEVVDEWVKVNQEIAEIKKDLGRLGWSE